MRCARTDLWGGRVGNHRLYPAPEDEAREFIIGYSLTQRLLLLVYVDQGERTRIISARQTTRPERKLYEEA